MTEASGALVRMDYLTCERLCLDALASARRGGHWSYYAKILLPLQEARRQRRLIAAEGVIRLGTSDLTSPPLTWLDAVHEGCLVVTRPHTIEDARMLHEHARANRMHVAVLFADSDADEATWRLRSYRVDDVETPFQSPPRAWRGRWLPAREVPSAEEARASIKAPATPADWFLDACEALGDAALATLGSDDFAKLEAMLDVAPDHEILHQRLAAAAMGRARAGAGV